MKNWKFVIIGGLLIMSQILVACGPATTPTTEVPAVTQAQAEPTKALPEPTKAQPEPTKVPEPTTPPEPVDIVLWAQATVTEAAAPPDDWIAYQKIRDDLNINLTYVIV